MWYCFFKKVNNMSMMGKVRKKCLILYVFLEDRLMDGCGINYVVI